MVPRSLLHVHAEVADALAAGRPVVALESTLIAHGLPRPTNLETARASEAIIRTHGAVPATIAAFDLTTSGLPVSARVDSPEEAARLLGAHWALDGAGVVIARPVPAEVALDPADFRAAWEMAERLARERGVRGAARTPFLL